MKTKVYSYTIECQQEDSYWLAGIYAESIVKAIQIIYNEVGEFTVLKSQNNGIV